MRSIVAGVAVALGMALTGCATHRAAPAPQPVASYGTEYGVVQSIDTVRAQSQTTGGGALLGAAVGGIVGRQFGSHGGRDAATVVGVVAGAIAGNEIEKNRQGATDIYRVTVRLDQGRGVRSFDYASLNDLRVGDRVKVENNQLYRW